MLLSPCPYGDLRLKLLLTAAGKAVYLHAFTCEYRLNSAGSAMAAFGTEARRKTELRWRQTLAMLQNVDAFSGGCYHAELRALMDAQHRVLLEAAPRLALLKNADLRRVYRTLPLQRRVKFHIKSLLPQSAFAALRRVRPGK